jgi:hypothetical protein
MTTHNFTLSFYCVYAAYAALPEEQKFCPILARINA